MAPAALNQLATPDSLRAVLDSVFAGPEYRWLERPTPLGFLQRWWLAIQDWMLHAQETNPVLFEVAFWVMVTIVVLIFVHGGWIIFHTVRAAAANPESPTRPSPAAARDAAWYFAEADRLAVASRHTEALQAAFQGLVLDLDHRRLVRFHPSKTPGEYASEQSLTAPQRERLRQLVRTLYGYVFARQPSAAAEYRAWRELAGGEWHAAAH
jgi:hypothetical protein